jgi:cytochrome c assembly protein
MLPYLDYIIYTAAGFYFLSLLAILFKRNNFAYFFLITGFIIHTLFLVLRGSICGVSYLNPVFEGPFFVPWVIAFISIYNRFKKEESWKFLIIPLILFSIFAVFYPSGIIPPTPKKPTLFAGLFFLTEVGGHALFYSSASIAFMFLFNKSDYKGVHTYIAWGFILFSISQVLGALWAYYGWGSTFRWGPRHFTTASIWLLYALFLHLRFMPNWTERKKAVFSIVAALLTIFTSYFHYIQEMRFPRIGG